MDTSKILCMLIAKLPGGLMDRKRDLGEPDLQDLINFVEEQTLMMETLMNDALFSREALHEYTKHPEKTN